MASTLMIHTPGSHRVSREDLRALPEPVAIGARHRPVPHAEVVDALQAGIRERGITIARTQLGVSQKGQRVFGTMDLRFTRAATLPPSDLGTTFGFRSSTNSTLSIKGVAGARVFVCDNLVLSGSEFVLQRKHTTFLNLAEAVSNGLNRFLAQTETLGRGIDRLKDTPLSDGGAKQHVFDVFDAGAMPLHLFDDVARFYMRPKPDHLDCQPRSLWGLVNACTRAIQVLRPQAQFNASLNVGRHFQLVTA